MKLSRMLSRVREVSREAPLWQTSTEGKGGGMGHRRESGDNTVIFQARTLEWVAISYSRTSSWPRDWTRPAWTGRFFTTLPLGKPAGWYEKPKPLTVVIGCRLYPGKGMILGKSPSSVKSNSWKGYLLATPPAAGGLPTSVLSDTSPCPSQQTSN